MSLDLGLIVEEMSKPHPQKKARKLYNSTFNQFKRLTFFHLLCRLFFVLLLCVELFALVLSIQKMPASSVIALHIGVLVFTLFTFLLLHIYLEAKKKEQFEKLKTRFINSCRLTSNQPVGSAEHHLCIADHLLQFAKHLFELQHRFYSPPKIMAPLSSLYKQIGYKLHGKDLFYMQEGLYLAAIEEHIAQIKTTPTDLEVHGSLASTYTELAKFYLAKEKLQQKLFQTISHKGNWKQKFAFAAQQAIEELHILNDYAPNNPWVHAQLAQTYHQLEMYKEEIRELEKLLSLNPSDMKITYKLARCCFEQGQKAKGLKFYQTLLDHEVEGIESLLAYYNATHIHKLRS